MSLFTPSKTAQQLFSYIKTVAKQHNNEELIPVSGCDVFCRAHQFPRSECEQLTQYCFIKHTSQIAFIICQIKNKLTVANFWYLAPKNILKKEEQTVRCFFPTPLKNKIGGAIYYPFFNPLAI